MSIRPIGVIVNIFETVLEPVIVTLLSNVQDARPCSRQYPAR